jgi:O-antigen ligase
MGNFDLSSTLAFSLIFPLFLIIGLLTECRFKTVVKFGLVLSLMAMVAAILFTYTRSCWIGIISGLIVFLSLIKKGIRYLLPVLAVSTILILLFPTLRSRLSAFGMSEKDYEGRLFIWSRAMEMINDHPVFGFGYGNF